MRQPTSLCCSAVCGGGVRERTMPLAWLLSHFLSLPSLPTSGLCPFRCWFTGKWVCVHSRTPWVPPMDSPVKLAVSPAAKTPIEFYNQRFWVFSFLYWNPGFCGLSHFPVVSLGLSAQNVGLPGPVPASPTRSAALPSFLFDWLPFSLSSTGLDECFFNSLVVRVPCSLIFWPFWLFFCF